MLAFGVSAKSYLAQILNGDQQRRLMEMLTLVPEAKYDVLQGKMMPLIIANVKIVYGSQMRYVAELIAVTRSCMHPLAPDRAVIQQSLHHSSRLHSALMHMIHSRLGDPYDKSDDCSLRQSAGMQPKDIYQMTYYAIDYQWTLMKVDAAPYSSLVMTYLCPTEMEVELCPLFRSIRELEECAKIAGFTFSEEHLASVCSHTLSDTLTAVSRQGDSNVIVP
jgi:hypothetical protein